MPLRRSATKTPAEARDAIGLAFKSFAENRSGNANEATTRVELIDEVLRAVGWPTGSIERERPTGTGDFIDYELNVDGPWMVVEAKRVGESFRLSQKSGRAQHPSRSVQSLISTGGESLRDTVARVLPYFIREILPRVLETGAVTVVGHGNSLRALAFALEPFTEAQIMELEFATGEAVAYQFGPSGRTLRKRVFAA